jgi:glycolate oxidase iron-sulfur subunit
MQTFLDPRRLAEPATARANAILRSCVHCGLCLPACPTYDELGLEPDSPRGRIVLLRALAEGRIEEPSGIRSHLDQCLGCRACESVCPSGVRYGEILESARGVIERRWPGRGWRAGARRFLLTRIIAHQGRLRRAFALLRLAEVLGLRWLAGRVGLVPELTALLLPQVPPAAARRPLTGTFEPSDECRGTVALFTGCVMEQVFGDLNRQTLRLLLANGFRVHATPGQVCCGALQLHDGQVDAAIELAERNVRAFAGAEFIVNNSAGCGNALKEYGHLLGTAAAAEFAGKCRDVCEFLGDHGMTATPAPFPHRVAYDDPCHLCHGQKIRRQPRDLLRQVPGLQLVDHPEAEACCGSAGIYNLNQPELAAAIGRAKVAQLGASGAEVVVSGNPGCIMQIRAHLRLAGSSQRVLHPVELLLPESG